MKSYKIIYLLFMFCVLTFHTQAQQSSKSKSSSKVYEKGGDGDVRLINAKRINTGQLEFSPSFYQNGIVFVSTRNQHGQRDRNINEPFFELFYAELDGAGIPLEPKPFSVEMNSAYHEGQVTFNRAGDVIYFTRNNLQKGLTKSDSEGKIRLKVFEAKRGYFDWEDVVELPFNSDDYSVAHPTLSVDGRKLYFASDMPGGKGGMDLYVVEKNGDEWAKPVNLGSPINTEKNELFPFIHSSGNLIFTSNGHPGAGGLDLFMTSIGDNMSNQIINLGEPFNSPADDLGLILNPDGTRGYFTSSRSDGKGKDDIYMFEAPDGIWGKTRALTIDATIKVFDKITGQRLENAAIRIFEKTPEGFIGSGNNLYDAVLLPVEEGSSELVFKLIRKDAGALGAADKLTDFQGEAKHSFTGERNYIILVAKEGFTSNEVSYATIGNTGEKIIAIPLDPISCTNISGIVRSSKDNSRLAGAVVKIKNSCNDTEEVIVANNEGEYAYCLPSDCEYTLVGVKENYTKGTASVKSNYGSPAISKDLLLTPVAPTTYVPSKPTITTGTVIVLENIYYDFNKSAIRSGAARELDELVTIMRSYPSMQIELIAHTDSRGGTRYNQRLSQKRAESARQYLVSRGISSSRVRAIGMGEAELRNHCSDGRNCSEEDHQYNRRTEVKVVNIDSSLKIQYGNNGPEVIDRRGN